MPKVGYKQTTVGHYGLRWFDHESLADKFANSSTLLTVPMYVGMWDKVPDALAQKLATIHPNFAAYYEDAMMPLWALHGMKVKYGDSENGTESPKLALAWQTKDTHPFVVIWRIFTGADDNG